MDKSFCYFSHVDWDLRKNNNNKSVDACHFHKETAISDLVGRG